MDGLIMLGFVFATAFGFFCGAQAMNIAYEQERKNKKHEDNK